MFQAETHLGAWFSYQTFFLLYGKLHLLCETCRMNTLKLVVLPADGPVSLAFSVEDSSPQIRCRKTTWNYNVGLSELRDG